MTANVPFRMLGVGENGGITAALLFSTGTEVWWDQNLEQYRGDTGSEVRCQMTIVWHLYAGI